jgi:hypothetical protein
LCLSGVINKKNKERKIFTSLFHDSENSGRNNKKRIFVNHIQGN